PRVLGVMLGNLLSNAVRFTDRGRIHVRLGADRLEVSDTGIGMDASALARAFEPFYRADFEHPAGPGLGLSIAHRLGRRCRWPLQMASTPGEGTRATILLGAGNQAGWTPAAACHPLSRPCGSPSLPKTSPRLSQPRRRSPAFPFRKLAIAVVAVALLGSGWYAWNQRTAADAEGGYPTE